MSVYFSKLRAAAQGLDIYGNPLVKKESVEDGLQEKEEVIDCQPEETEVQELDSVADDSETEKVANENLVAEAEDNSEVSEVVESKEAVEEVVEVEEFEPVLESLETPVADVKKSNSRKR